MLQLNEITNIPDAFFQLTSLADIHHVFPQPTLIHLQGENPQPLFVSVLMHGNEDTGFFAIQKLLLKYQQRKLPRALSIFIGNVSAARSGLRRLNGQPDYNRVWPGSDVIDCPESRLMLQVVERMQQTLPFASIDLHNNTGMNPHYGCINRLDVKFLQLAKLFSRTVVYFETPTGVQSMAFAEFCPAITVECGKPHLPNGIAHAMDYVDSVLHLSDIEGEPVSEKDVDLFHTVARVTVSENCSFSFTDRQADIFLDPGIEQLNFSEAQKGMPFGEVGDGVGMGMGLIAWDDRGNDMTERFFQKVQSQIQLNISAMPAMITLNEEIVRQDCLCYLMERMQWEWSRTS
ncbi:MAG: M14 family metallopeptidase [Gammaproteobacteria bacterium]